MYKKKSCTAVIVAGGIGKRMDTDIPKQFLLLGDKPILVNTLEVFENCRAIDDITVVCVEGYISYCKKLLERFEIRKVKKVVPGGALRQFSVYSAIKSVNSEFVCIHDAVRPLVKSEMIEKTIDECEIENGCICAVKAKDTMKICNGYVEKTLPREKVFHVQTPQTFRTQILKKAYERAIKENFTCTDDSSLMEHYGYKIKVIESDYTNIKITEPSDLLFTRIYLGIEK